MADGDPIRMGVAASNEEQSGTTVRNSTMNPPSLADGAGLLVYAGGDGPGVFAVGRGPAGRGVMAYSYQDVAVWGIAFYNPSVPAFVGRVGVQGDGPVGVYGRSESDFGIGVEGDALGQSGIGVYGVGAGVGGIGIYAYAPFGSTALEVNGKASFSQSGKLTVPAGASQATVAGVELTGNSLVLANLQEDRPGVAVRAVVPNPATSSFTVFLTQAVTAASIVGWFVVN
jgi:hypothetical protein